MNRIIQMVLLTFFSMLVFSNFIIMLTTTYISLEVEFLMSQPVSHRRLFFGKLAESMIYSSWAFVLLSFPFFMALRHARHLGFSYYLGSFVLIVPYLVIPAAAGAALALVLTAWCPPRKMIRYAISLALVGLFSSIVTYRMYGLSRLIQDQDNRMLTNVMRFMQWGDLPLLPSGWLGRGLLAIEDGRWQEAGFWAGMLWSSALMGLVICDWLAGALYYKGWCNSRASGGTGRRRTGGLYRFFDLLFGVLPRGTRAMVTKDLTVFWRDPSQWGQLCMLFGLLFVYIANLRSAAQMNNILIPFWQSLISMCNIGATGFVLSILSTRFVYPMLSLEGKQQWVIGLAPVSRTRVVWVKFLVSWAGSQIVSLPLALFSSYVLDVPRPILGISLLTVSVLSIGLSSLAVGLGALMPNFSEDNPSRIANGLGGTLNAIASLFYMIVTLLLEVPWIHAYVNGFPGRESVWWWLLVASLPIWVTVQILMLVIPMRLGLRHWRQIEF